MEELKVGDRVEVYNDPEVNEQKRTGIWHMPFCQPRDIGKRGTVVRFEGSRSHGPQVLVHFDGDSSNTLRMYDNDDRWLRKI